LFVIWVESDFWLNYLQILKNKKIKTILINARISNSSYLRWKKIKFLLKEVLNVFSSIYPSSNGNLIKYKEFYNDNLECIGNLKYVFREKLDIKLESINLKLQNIKQNDFIIFGLSTHFGEEVILLENFLKLKEIYSNLKLIILPRHIDRCDNLVLDLKKIYKNINLVDLMQPFNVINLGDVLIVKNIGIVSYLCKISNIVYVGRSLSVKKRGGQNIVEPMGLGKFVIVGKNMENFLDIVDEIMLEKNLGFVMLNHKNELFDVIKGYYLLDDLKKNHYKINNINYIKNKQFILDKYLSIIESIMLENGKTC
jgi:tRNA (guanine-N7-)-methyltransferase